jgi:hypothetical protein
MSDEDQNYSRLKHYGNGNNGEITLINEKMIKGKNLSINSDTTQWINAETQQNQKIPHTQIKEIKLKNRLSGAVAGLMIGLLPTTIAAALLAYFLYGEDSDQSPGSAAGLGVLGVAYWEV